MCHLTAFIVVQADAAAASFFRPVDGVLHEPTPYTLPPAGLAHDDVLDNSPGPGAVGEVGRDEERQAANNPSPIIFGYQKLIARRSGNLVKGAPVFVRGSS